MRSWDPFEILRGASFPGRQAKHGARTTDLVTEEQQNNWLPSSRLCSSVVSELIHMLRPSSSDLLAASSLRRRR
jgi:hypothetical protein